MGDVGVQMFIKHKLNQELPVELMFRHKETNREERKDKGEIRTYANISTYAVLRSKQLIRVIISGDFLIRFCIGRVAIRYSPASP